MLNNSLARIFLHSLPLWAVGIFFARTFALLPSPLFHKHLTNLQLHAPLYLTRTHFKVGFVFRTFAATGNYKTKSIMRQYFLLLLAIVFEVIATNFLKQSEQFTRWLPAVVTVIGYAASFYLLSMVLRSIPMGIAYAIWSGVGIVLVALTGWLIHKQALDLPALIGIAMIIGGVLVINLFSHSAGH